MAPHRRSFVGGNIWAKPGAFLAMEMGVALSGPRTGRPPALPACAGLRPQRRCRISAPNARPERRGPRGAHTCDPCGWKGASLPPPFRHSDGAQSPSYRSAHPGGGSGAPSIVLRKRPGLAKCSSALPAGAQRGRVLCRRLATPGPAPPTAGGATAGRSACPRDA